MAVNTDEECTRKRFERSGELSLGVIYFSGDCDCKYGGVAAGARRNHRAFLFAE
jgi:hypothetical protein